MPVDEKKEGEPKVTFDLGFGGLFKGVGDLIDLISEMAEKGQQVVDKTGEFEVKGLGDKGRAVYGFSVRTGIGGIPRVERFGNVRATETGPVVAEVREPLVDLFDEEKEFVVVAELPGVAEEELEIELHEDILSLQTSGRRKYAKELLLPSPVKADTLQRTYRNGILEIRIEKQ